MTTQDAVRIRHEAIRRARWTAELGALTAEKCVITQDHVRQQVIKVCDERGLSWDDAALQRILGQLT